MKEQYTLGYASTSVAFVERRRLHRDGVFFLPFLSPGAKVLDCGCGPGTITCDIAKVIGTGGEVIGVDAALSQVELAGERAARMGATNARFQSGDVYALPFTDRTFDCVFSHALLEHLADPLAAMKEFHRVLKPSGWVGVRTPDWGGFLYSPQTPELMAAIECFTDRQNASGGDVRCGHKLRDYALAAGFHDVKPHATYEVFEPVWEILDLLIDQCAQQEHDDHVKALKDWGSLPGVLFSEAWVSCVGRK
ncbi:MAG TPA: methyltransferase domain-containing protein [Burkholderiales bacterium]|nr:methyltransferase domain-containing protein [Burkholderiales bacterium]